VQSEASNPVLVPNIKLEAQPDTSVLQIECSNPVQASKLDEVHDIKLTEKAEAANDIVPCPLVVDRDQLNLLSNPGVTLEVSAKEGNVVTKDKEDIGAKTAVLPSSDLIMEEPSDLATLASFSSGAAVKSLLDMEVTQRGLVPVKTSSIKSSQQIKEKFETELTKQVDATVINMVMSFDSAQVPWETQEDSTNMVPTTVGSTNTPCMEGYQAVSGRFLEGFPN
jgi:hypothetical protein